MTDEKVSLDVGKLIQQSRMEKKLTQKDLATVRQLMNKKHCLLIIEVANGKI